MSTAWPRVRLGEVLTQDKQYFHSTEPKLYKKISVKLYGKGAVLDAPVDGASLKMQKHQLAKSGQIILSEIWAKKGAIGIVPMECDGALCTSHFFLFDIDENLLHRKWIANLLRVNYFEAMLGAEARGTTGYAAVRPAQFLACEIPLPPAEDQRRIVARIDAVQQQLQQADALRASIARDIASLLAVRFQETLHHAEWRPMREVAPLVRREVTIYPEKMYSELGIRSFFKGAFVRRSLAGAEFTWQKLCEIKAGDLIFSNIMAWEKGIALAGAEHDGCVGNHRMLTCEALVGTAHPEYLSYYFTTEDGFSKVYAASPGTAARNRTLTADSLMALTVPVPTVQTQQQFVALQAELAHLAQVRADEAEPLAAVVPALIARTMQG